MSKASSRDVLNQGQFTRISAIQGGFFYQNLYAAACMLALATLDEGSVGVERDEDVEIDTPDSVYFIQVKKRAGPLYLSDIESALQRFKELRKHQKNSADSREVVFVIAANSPPSPALMALMGKWPSDTHYSCPGRPVPNHPLVPEPRSTLAAQLEHTTETASELGFQGLMPGTLVLKLSAYAHYLSTGRVNGKEAHQVAHSELSSLFETYAVQMQYFPQPPDIYLPQTDEPSLQSGIARRLIVGFSGAGKTSWAASLGVNHAAPALYFDTKGILAKDIGSALAGEIVSLLHNSSNSVGSLPVGAGLESLGWANAHIIQLPVRPVLVIDNVHTLPVETIKAVLARLTSFDVVCLSQPTDQTNYLASQLGITVEELKGWPLETVALVFHDAGCSMSPARAERVRRLTGGRPMVVTNAAEVAKQTYEGDVGRFLKAITDGDMVDTLAAEIIVEQAIKTLSNDARTVMALLAKANVPLEPNELKVILSSTRPEEDLTTSLKHLSRIGLIRQSQGMRLVVHDSVNVAGTSEFARLPKTVCDNYLSALCWVLGRSVRTDPDHSRLFAFIRLLPVIGQSHILAEFASYEMFHELGNADDIRQALENLIVDPAATPDTRFTAADALAYWEMKSDPQVANPIPYLNHMESLLESHPEELDANAVLNFAMKTMMLAGREGRNKDVSKGYAFADKLILAGTLERRILDYNFAVALFQLDDIEGAESVTVSVAKETFKALRLIPADLIGTNRTELNAKVEPLDDKKRDELKRLGDQIDLLCRCQRKAGYAAVQIGMHPMKLYQQAFAVKSMVLSGQEYAQDMMDVGRLEVALNVFEKAVLSVSDKYGFHDLRLQLRSFYGVILAYAGRIEDARNILKELRAYSATMHSFEREGIDNQIKLIEDIARGEISFVQYGGKLPGPNLLHYFGSEVPPNIWTVT